MWWRTTVQSAAPCFSLTGSWIDSWMRERFEGERVDKRPPRPHRCQEFGQLPRPKPLHKPFTLDLCPMAPIVDPLAMPHSGSWQSVEVGDCQTGGVAWGGAHHPVFYFSA